MTKIITYNVNGIRAALKKDWKKWVQTVDPDIICIQETKIQENQVDNFWFDGLPHKAYWHSAEKKGYSGVALFLKKEPNHIEYGCGIEKYDREGRVIRADYDNFSIISVYMPSGSSGEERQAFKMQWLADFQEYINHLKQEIPNLIIAGDYNICHQSIDIHNPTRNQNTSGFLPEEREWMTQFIDSGFTDSFRHLNKEPHNYTWWSYRARAREKNLGWRIDYQMVSNPITDKIKRVAILNQAVHSDHCPMLLEIIND